MDPYIITFETYNKAALAYEEKFMYLELYNDTYDAFCSLITRQGANVFEIGCGPGNITRYLLSKRPDFQLLAIDVAPNMIQRAIANNPAAHFEVMDCREMDRIAGPFDGIISGFCIPYLSKEAVTKLIKDCAALLQRGGIFYGSVIEGNYTDSGFVTSNDGQHRSYVYYYGEETLLTVLHANQFELVELQRKQYPQSQDLYSTHIIFIARRI
jgi:cyclopropane fatty-acyl-phospholipid synthase-like methyltransferase